MYRLLELKKAVHLDSFHCIWINAERHLPVPAALLNTKSLLKVNKYRDIMPVIWEPSGDSAGPFRMRKNYL